MSIRSVEPFTKTAVFSTMRVTSFGIEIARVWGGESEQPIQIYEFGVK